jgi:hypothetical protein
MKKKERRCEECDNCIYIEHGDQVCDYKDSWKFVFNDFIPTKDYIWCQQEVEI